MEQDGFGATVTYNKGVFSLHIMRPHIWDCVELPTDYSKALEMVDDYLENFPKPLVHRVKQRLTKITQLMMLEPEMRRMIITVPSKSEKIEVPVLEKSVDIKLLERRKRDVENVICRLRKRPTIIYELDSEEEDEEVMKAGPLKDAEYGS